VIVVNTCSFIDRAQRESVDTILEMAQLKAAGKTQKLVVAGCLVERYRDEIRKNIPEVDAVVGTGELEAILRATGIEFRRHYAASTACVPGRARPVHRPLSFAARRDADDRRCQGIVRPRHILARPQWRAHDGRLFPRSAQLLAQQRAQKRLRPMSGPVPGQPT